MFRKEIEMSSGYYSQDEEDIAKIIASLLAIFAVVILAVIIPSYSLEVQVEPANVGGSVCVRISPEASPEKSESVCVEEVEEGETSVTFSGLGLGKYYVHVEEVGSSGEGKPSVPSFRDESVEIVEKGTTTIRISMSPSEETGGGE